MPVSIEGCVFGERAMVVRFNIEHQNIPHALDALHNVVRYREDVQDLVIEQNFGTTTPNHFTNVAAEAASIVAIRSLLALLSSTLCCLTLNRQSCDPLHPSLDSKRLLKEFNFPSLKSLSICGSPSTTQHFSLPLLGGFAPELKNLQLSSDMLADRLSYAIPHAFPRLTHFTVHPLRPFYTTAQLDALMKIGEYLGVFTSEINSTSYADVPRVPRSCIVGQGLVVVVAYVEPGATRREEEVRRFEQAVVGRLVPGMEKSFKLCVEGVDPSLEAMTRAAELQCLSECRGDVGL